MVKKFFFCFPVDPVAFSVGSWPIRWYGILYVFGFFAARWYGVYGIKRGAFPHITKADFLKFSDGALWAAIIGGRLGEVLLYNPLYYWYNPGSVLRLWQGGLSFHGGIAAVLLWMLWYCRRKNIAYMALGNMMACCAPIGLFFGRLGNFINQELYGKPTTFLLGMVFPAVDDLRRHPSQLYEAFGEGIILFFLLFFLTWRHKRVPPYAAGLFLLGYALARFAVEWVKIPDGWLMGMTLGQVYSLPMALVGIFLIILAKKDPL